MRASAQLRLKGSELDELIDQWTHDRTAVRDRTLELIRFAHVLMGPLVVGGLFAVMPERSLVMAGLFYCTGMVRGVGTRARRRQAGSLAIF